MGQVLERAAVGPELEKVRKEKKIVFTNGCFDLLHVGHVTYLKEAKALGDLLVVGVNSDASVKRLKGNERPIQSERDRAEILASLEAVDIVSIFEEDTADEIIKVVRPNIFVKGGDWKVDQIKEAPLVLSFGGEVQSLPFIKGRSTTDIVDRILNSRN